MASASREAIRTRARMESENVCDQHLEASDSVVSLALTRFCRRKRQGALAWLSGFRAGFYGAPYVRPHGALDPQVWVIGFIEGRGSRGRM
jgi:hypothetical protein